uniref:Bromo domain-containing protein n=1 Tax=Scophthalmus maximus TaxID=52904 RepID=A0A8D3DS68_SCOMX
MSEQITAACSQPLFHNRDFTVTDRDQAPRQLSTDLVMAEDLFSNGICEVDTMEAILCPGDGGDVTAEGDLLALRNDGMSEFSNSDLSLPEVCISTNSNSLEEEDMNREVQQAYRIFTGFLSDKHKGITSRFLHPISHQEAQHGIGGVRGWGQAQLRQSMCLRRMEEKFSSQGYETITEFVADFRLMLENCYRYHGVDHWISKQAQKLEIMLEQKLTLLSRTLREKTTLAVTSKGRFGAEEERGSGGTSTRRRLAPRSLATLTVGGHESIMVQALRQEEQQRAKEEKRQRELEKKEAEEMSAKEVEEWEQTLLSQASPHTVDALWELPAIGHFLCLAQTALYLPEIVFFELERCLLMPRCSLLLSKIMSSLLSPPQRRATLQRRPPLPYRRWESELRQRVMAWYRVVGMSHDQPGRAEHLGLCHQFFSTLGEVSPLEEKPFHLLPFYQRLWVLKGLCDHVYETQKSVQDAVLAQPIHECRESILGYDSRENAYIHFPHFCGADLRIYCQSPSAPTAFPFPSVLVKRVETEPGTEVDESDGMKAEGNKSDRECYGGSMDTGESDDFVKGRAETCVNLASPSKTSKAESEGQESCYGTSGQAAQVSSENSSEERMNDKIWTTKKRRKKKRGRELLQRVKGEHKHQQQVDRMSLSPVEDAKCAVRRVLVCTSLEELRVLISKTEDELDDLESSKKRLDRWYYRREAVKDLHSTLIRLLNELSPWEPKLVKAYQRNRLRLKKEFDDFKKHPEYNNFVREECISSSSSSDEDDESGSGKELFSLADHYRRSEEEDLEHIVPRGLWKKGGSLLPRGQTGSRNITSAAESGQSRSELVPLNQSLDSNLAMAAGSPAQTTMLSRPTILHPTTGLPKGYTPIPTLLAKSVGNKVTLMKRQGSLGPLPTSTVPKSSVQVVCKIPEGLGQLAKKDSSSPVKISVHPATNHSTGEKIMQQVVILNSNILIPKTEEKTSSLHQQQSKDIQVKVASPLCMSTSVPGFTIPENRIPVQQVAPLKHARTVRTPSPSDSPFPQQGIPNTAAFKGANICSPQASPQQGVIPKLSPITPPSSTGISEPTKSKDLRQELKTVCIRDSQSILVTTRGGNTGIVKVQTSDHSVLGCLPTSPVITISPQFKAFLVSKSSTSFSHSAPSQTSPCTIPSLSTVTTPMHTAVTASIPISGSQIVGTTVALSQGSNTSAGTTVAKTIGQQAQTAAASHIQTSSVKNAAVVPSLSSPGVPQVLKQTEKGTSTSTSNAATLPAGNMIKKLLCMRVSQPSSSTPAQVTTTVQSSPAQTSTPPPARQQSYLQSGIGEESSLSSSPQLAPNTTHTSISSAATTSTPFSTSATGTIQQRVVINTSTPLAAGTQIILNNTRFVVPPQGLGPGSHVLIISSPAPQQVPTVSATGASVPPQVANHATVAPQAPVLPQSPQFNTASKSSNWDTIHWYNLF